MLLYCKKICQNLLSWLTSVKKHKKSVQSSTVLRTVLDVHESPVGNVVQSVLNRVALYPCSLAVDDQLQWSSVLLAVH